MFCSRKSNNMINKLYERSLRTILNEFSSNLNILLENNNGISNHPRNIQALLVEVFRMKNELSPPIMESILNKRFNTCNRRNFQEFATERNKPFGMILRLSVTVILHSDPFSQKASKKLNSLNQSKRNIKHWIAAFVSEGYVKFIFKILDFYNVE